VEGSQAYAGQYAQIRGTGKNFDIRYRYTVNPFPNLIEGCPFITLLTEVGTNSNLLQATFLPRCLDKSKLKK
jgi:hypothetical protein